MDTRTGADIVAAEGKRTSVKLLRLCGVLILVNGVLLGPWWVLSGGLTAPWLALEAVAIVGVAFGALVGWRLIPVERIGKAALDQGLHALEPSVEVHRTDHGFEAVRENRILVRTVRAPLGLSQLQS